MAKFYLSFFIEGLPKTTNGNARRHWRALHAEATKWKALVAREVEPHIRISPGVYAGPMLTKAKLTLTRFSSSEPDFDGLVSSFKSCVDALIETGVIIDDKMSVIGQPIYKWEKCKPKQGKIKVVVESVEDISI